MSLDFLKAKEEGHEYVGVFDNAIIILYGAIMLTLSGRSFMIINLRGYN